MIGQPIDLLHVQKSEDSVRVRARDRPRPRRNLGEGQTTHRRRVKMKVGSKRSEVFRSHVKNKCGFFYKLFQKIQIKLFFLLQTFLAFDADLHSIVRFLISHISFFSIRLHGTKFEFSSFFDEF